MKYGQAFTESMKTAAGRALNAPDDLGADDLASAIKARRAAGKSGGLANGVIDATNRLRDPGGERLAASAGVIG